MGFPKEALVKCHGWIEHFDRNGCGVSISAKLGLQRGCVMEWCFQIWKGERRDASRDYWWNDR